MHFRGCQGSGPWLAVNRPPPARLFPTVFPPGLSGRSQRQSRIGQSSGGAAPPTWRRRDTGVMGSRVLKGARFCVLDGPPIPGRPAGRKTRYGRRRAPPRTARAPLSLASIPVRGERQMQGTVGAGGRPCRRFTDAGTGSPVSPQSASSSYGMPRPLLPARNTAGIFPSVVLARLWQILVIRSPKFTIKVQERFNTLLNSLVEGTTLLNTVTKCDWIESGERS